MPAANAGLAHLLIARKQFPEAEQLLRASLAKSPEDPALTAQLAAVLAAQNKAEALPLLQKLHAAHPEDPAVTRMLAEVLAEAGDAAGSDQLYVKFLAAQPDDPALLIAHGQNLIRLQLKFAEALAVFNRATERMPPTPTDGVVWPLPLPKWESLKSHCTPLPCDQNIFLIFHRRTFYGQHLTIHCTTRMQRSRIITTFWRRPLVSFPIRNGRPGSVFWCSRRSSDRAMT